MLQRAEGLLALAQQAQGPQQAGEDDQGHAQVQPELPGIGQCRGREDFILALADQHAEAALGHAPVQALVRVAGRVLGQHTCFTAAVRQPGQQGVASHHHAAAIDAQPLQAVILQQTHQATVAQVDRLEQRRQVADVQLHHQKVVDFPAGRIGQRQQEGQAPSGRGSVLADRLNARQERFETVAVNVPLQLVQPVCRQLGGLIGVAGR
ncbi:hypothetical protein D9M73_163850 [compost metagenome]